MLLLLEISSVESSSLKFENILLPVLSKVTASRKACEKARIIPSFTSDAYAPSVCFVPGRDSGCISPLDAASLSED